MSTRSFIGYVDEDGDIHAIYCHFDGYLEGVGFTLVDHYRKFDKVRKLVSLGAIDSLHPNLSRGEHTVAFDRDLGNESGINIGDLLSTHLFNTEKKYTEYAYEHNAEYVYLFKNNKWYYNEWENKEFRPI